MAAVTATVVLHLVVALLLLTTVDARPAAAAWETKVAISNAVAAGVLLKHSSGRHQEVSRPAAAAGTATVVDHLRDMLPGGRKMAGAADSTTSLVNPKPVQVAAAVKDVERRGRKEGIAGSTSPPAAAEARCAHHDHEVEGDLDVECELMISGTFETSARSCSGRPHTGTINNLQISAGTKSREPLTAPPLPRLRCTSGPRFPVGRESNHHPSPSPTTKDAGSADVYSFLNEDYHQIPHRHPPVHN